MYSRERITGSKTTRGRDPFGAAQIRNEETLLFTKK